jgi:hypothetical protein
MAENKQDKPEEPVPEEPVVKEDPIRAARKEEALGRLKKVRAARYKEVFKKQVARVLVCATPFRISVIDLVSDSMVNMSSHDRYACQVNPIEKAGQPRQVILKNLGHNFGGGASLTISGDALPTNASVLELANIIGEAGDVARHEASSIQGGSGFGWG